MQSDHSHNDPRGSFSARVKAQCDIRAFFHDMRKQDPQFEKHYAYLRASFAGKGEFRNLPYTQWLDLYRKRWTEVLAADIRANMTITPVWEGTGHQAQNFSREVYQSYFGDTSINGKRADSVVIDDPHNQEKPVKTPKVKEPKKDYNTVGVRFLRGGSLHKVYTYKVPKKVKLRLGEEIVVPTLYDGQLSNVTAVVVELHPKPQDTQFGIIYRFVYGRIHAL